jgi:O-antigen/teichoic acid export membrane protein
LIKNIIRSFITRSTVAAVNLAILLIASKNLGSAAWGQASLIILNVAIIQTINDIYTGSALVYFIPQSSLRKIYVTGLLWTIGCIITINMLFMIFAVGLREYQLHVFIVSLLLTLQSFHNVIFLAKEKIALYNNMLLIQPLLLLTVVCLNIYLFRIGSVMAYIYALYFSSGLVLIFSSYRIASLLKMVSHSAMEFNPSFIFRNGFMNELGNLAHTLSNRFNYYMLQANVAIVGIYASGTSLIESVWIISASISPVVLTFIANRKEHPDNYRITLLLSKLSFLIALVCIIGLFFIPETFFTVLLGNDFSGIKNVMLWLAPGVLCVSFSSIISHFYSGQGRQNILLKANVLGLLVTICTSYFLIRSFGITGACFAAALSYFVQALVLVITFVNENKIPFSRLFSLKEDLRLITQKN